MDSSSMLTAVRLPLLLAGWEMAGLFGKLAKSLCEESSIWQGPARSLRSCVLRTTAATTWTSRFARASDPFSAGHRLGSQ
jgi:hypothetical protein